MSFKIKVKNFRLVIERRHVIMMIFMVDLFLHGSIVFGWSSLNQIIADQLPDDKRKRFSILMMLVNS